jgi:predicted ester cyclase
MTPTIATQRIDLSPAVTAILQTDSPKSALLKHFLRYLEALIAHDPAGIDATVTPDVRCHELEAMGLPPGREGLKLFRRQVNAGIPDEHLSISAVTFEAADIIEADLKMTATHTGELLGVPATGRKIGFEVHERARFVEGKMAERWAKVDIEGIKRRLASPSP